MGTGYFLTILKWKTFKTHLFLRHVIYPLNSKLTKCRMSHTFLPPPILPNVLVQDVYQSLYFRLNQEWSRLNLQGTSLLTTTTCTQHSFTPRQAGLECSLIVKIFKVFLIGLQNKTKRRSRTVFYRQWLSNSHT